MGSKEGPAFERLGALPQAGGTTHVAVWAPTPDEVAVRAGGRDHPLRGGAHGVRAGEVPLAPGDDYLLVADGEALPDPCSRCQPQGAHGPSRVLDTGAFRWTDAGWGGLSLDDLVVYELHVGAFSEEGTFAGVVPRLAGLRELGVTALELMPVATFPGEHGWGYDVLYAYAPHPVYGGPAGLARLVDAAHAAGLGVILDVVYNHLGPGNEALAAFGPYASDRHETPWGAALDYSRRGVREWALQNVEYWTREFHVDGLRLDAVQAIADEGEPHICAELKRRAGRALVISEAADGDWRPLEDWGHDAQWFDRPHHELHVRLTGEREGAYAGVAGSPSSLAEDLRGRGRDPRRLVVCAQNHDQVGNRPAGDRLPPDALKTAAAVTLFSPCTPLLFMGEEYLETRPFRFFAGGADPRAAEAFLRSKLEPRPPDPLYRRLLELRRKLPRSLDASEADDEAGTLRLRRGHVELVADLDRRRVELRDA